MSHLFIYVVVALAVAAGWWLSGYDSHVTGENKVRDFIWRAGRILATATLIYAWGHLHAGPYGGVALIMIIPVSIGLIWCGCLADWWSMEFHRMLYPDTKGSFDPDHGYRQLDRVAAMLRDGQHEEAVHLCEKLLESGDANVLAMETLLTRAGIDWKASRSHDPLVTAYRLRAQGNFAEAEKTLLDLIAGKPTNIQARLLLIRLYAQDLKQVPKAEEALARLEKVRHVPAWQVDYARASIYDWAKPEQAGPAAPEVLPESIDELLLRGYPGTAIEKLELKISEQPGDFDSWLKLAEARGKYCGDIRSAEKIVRKIEGNPAFTPEQVQLATSRLSEWRAARPPARI